MWLLLLCRSVDRHPEEIRGALSSGQPWLCLLHPRWAVEPRSRAVDEETLVQALAVPWITDLCSRLPRVAVAQAIREG